jgi:hypothetical protein
MDEDTENIVWEAIWTHQAGRTIWELENICMKNKCGICKLM